jgi:hypothetical protein
MCVRHCYGDMGIRQGLQMEQAPLRAAPSLLNWVIGALADRDRFTGTPLHEPSLTPRRTATPSPR